jgi:transposase
VKEVIVCDPRRNKLLGEGSKADKPDARKLAELLRAGLLRPVYHGHEATRELKELVRGYETLSADVQRMMVRIKAIYRAHGIRTPGSAVYQQKQREQWLQLLTAPGSRQRVSWLYEELDHLRPLRKQAKRAMLAEGRKHQPLACCERFLNWGQFAAPCLSQQWTRRIDFARSISYGPTVAWRL